MLVSSKLPDPANKLPHPSAALHVYSEFNNTGVLLPRFENQNLTNIAVPVHGMIVFNTDKKCFMVYDEIFGKWDEIGMLEKVATPTVAGTEGEILYSTDNNSIWWYTGTEWKEFDVVP